MYLQLFSNLSCFLSEELFSCLNILLHLVWRVSIVFSTGGEGREGKNIILGENPASITSGTEERGIEEGDSGIKQGTCE